MSVELAFEDPPRLLSVSDPEDDVPDEMDTASDSLLSELPEEHDYRVVWMNRDLEEILASQQRMLERSGNGERGGDSAALRHAFEAQLKKVRAELERRRVPVFDVAYARAVAKPFQVASEVCLFLGGDLDAKSAASAVDSALYRQRSTTA